MFFTIIITTEVPLVHISLDRRACILSWTKGAWNQKVCKPLIYSI